MALTYDQSNTLMQDAAFRGRVKVACLKYADSILNEAPTVPAHNTRYRWAQQCDQQPDQTALTITPPTVMDPAVQQDGSNITDTALQGSVETVINKLL
ncbi:MAG TPA: hypothetical protein VE030_11310 [Burkholderiales bacterium]|nr:hypothetical protein [Burkholderiales bacterium]